MATLFVLYNNMPGDYVFWLDPPDLPEDWEYIGDGFGLDGYDREVQFGGPEISTKKAQKCLDRWFELLQDNGEIGDYEITPNLDGRIPSYILWT